MDGSLIGGKCGSGVLARGKSVDIKFLAPMPEHSTVFQCEVKAILAALQQLGHIMAKRIGFYVDSHLRSFC